MPGLPLAAFPVPLPVGLPADGLLLAALPLAAFLRDISRNSKLPVNLNRSKQTNPGAVKLRERSETC